MSRFSHRFCFSQLSLLSSIWSSSFTMAFESCFSFESCITMNRSLLIITVPSKSGTKRAALRIAFSTRRSSTLIACSFLLFALPLNSSERKMRPHSNGVCRHQIATTTRAHKSRRVLFCLGRGAGEKNLLLGAALCLSICLKTSIIWSLSGAG